MGKIVTTILNNFSGGIVEDKRMGWEGSIDRGFTTKYFGLTKYFDIFTYPKKLVPYHKTLNTGEVKANKIVKFIYAPLSGVYVIYGLGAHTVSATDAIKIYYYDGTAWNAVTTGEGTTIPRNTEVLCYYKGYIYMFAGGSLLSRWHTSTFAYTEGYQNITYTSVVQPVLFPGDDCLYLFANESVGGTAKVYRLNNVTWNDVVLTLPSNLKITCAVPYGNFLAIGCITLDGSESFAFFWDRDSSLATLTERISFGKGQLKHLANLNNKLIGVMSFYPDDLYGLGKGKIIIKQASGNFAVTLNELTLDATVSDLMSATSVTKENKLYFPASATLKGDARLGIWAVDENGRISLDFVQEGATSYEGIFLIGNTWYIAHSGDGSFSRSDFIEAKYSTTLASVYESLIFNAGDSNLFKKLIGVAVMFEQSPTAGQIVLKYRIDGAISWTTIFTKTVAGGSSHGSINIESSGANLPEYKEIEFRIESTKGAVITGLKFKSEIVDKQLF